MNKFTRLFTEGLRPADIDKTEEEKSIAQKNLIIEFRKHLQKLGDKSLAEIPSEQSETHNQTETDSIIEMYLEDLGNLNNSGTPLTEDEMLEALKLDDKSLDSLDPIRYTTDDKKTTVFRYQVPGFNGVSYIKEVNFEESDHPRVKEKFQIYLAVLRAESNRSMEKMVEQ